MTISIDHIDASLPQTQCTQCGYPRCRRYAEAVAHGEADINRCPPGGAATIHALALLLGVDSKPLDISYGQHRPRTRAVIDETACIGCRKCIDACPVDAILGARKLMHTVIASECNGCELCLAPCPVDCIHLVPVAITGGPVWPEYLPEETERWRRRTEARLMRLERRPKPKLHSGATPRTNGTQNPQSEATRRKTEIRAAVERVKAKRAPAGDRGSS